MCHSLLLFILPKLYLPAYNLNSFNLKLIYKFCDPKKLYAFNSLVFHFSLLIIFEIKFLINRNNIMSC